MTAIVTVTKNRLHHLIRTVPAFLSNHPDILILVDYGSTDGTLDWIEKDLSASNVCLLYHKPDKEQIWARPQGLNTGCRFAIEQGADMLVTVDCDVVYPPHWLDHCFEQMRQVGTTECRGPWTIYSRHWGGKGRGAIVCSVDTFLSLNGFDEDYKPYGGENIDFVKRMKLLGKKLASWDFSFADHCFHGYKRDWSGTQNNNRILKSRTHYRGNIGREYIGWKDFGILHPERMRHEKT